MSVPPKIIIAIDGYSGCGKSTLAKDLARELSYVYIDSGAMYRSISLHILENGVALDDKEAVATSLKDVKLEFVASDQGNRIHLNGKDVSDRIRQADIASIVSQVAAMPIVRSFLLEQQRRLGHSRGIVMDGRDIGTVIFPDSEMKLFVTADLETRVQRRLLDHIRKGESVSADDVKNNLAMRDETDISREISPLRIADDSTILDNSAITQQQQLAFALKLYDQVISELTAAE